MNSAARTIYTTSRDYPTPEDVEDAPFGELISVRKTGLFFNAVHPIPAKYLPELCEEERGIVRSEILTRLGQGRYRSKEFEIAARQSLQLLREAQQVIKEDDEQFAANLSNLTIRPPRVAQDPRRIIEWTQEVEPLSPSPVSSSPSVYLTAEQTESSSARSTPRSRSRQEPYKAPEGPSSQYHLFDPVLPSVADRLRLAEHQLDGLQERLETLADPVQRGNLHTAIQTARTAISKARVFNTITQHAFNDAVEKTVRAEGLAYPEASGSADGAAMSVAKDPARHLFEATVESARPNQHAAAVEARRPVARRIEDLLYIVAPAWPQEGAPRVQDVQPPPYFTEYPYGRGGDREYIRRTRSGRHERVRRR
jgi:hypothetical protein